MRAVRQLRSLCCRGGALWLALVLVRPVAAHEFDPATLTLSERADGVVEMLWKVPARHAGQIDPLRPAGCVDRDVPVRQSSGRMQLERRLLDCPEPIAGADIGAIFTRPLPVDVVLQVRFADGRHWSTVVSHLQPLARVPAGSGGGHSFREYLFLGIDHILKGWDHLLFVLGLLLIVSGMKRLVLTITGFTIGHSITLGFAAMGWLVVPSRPVEVCIALSVMLLAREAIVAPADSVTRRYPWVVASGFGLLHGLGFGSTLLAIGLPESGLWRALLAFNLGVELGQLLFVAVVLAVAGLVRWILRHRAAIMRPQWLGYPMGIIAMFWVLERATQ